MDHDKEVLASAWFDKTRMYLFTVMQVRFEPRSSNSDAAILYLQRRVYCSSMVHILYLALPELSMLVLAQEVCCRHTGGTVKQYWA